ncbi:MAG: TatD family hydrolase [Clostridia bacterium]|nr:TatD family hydrolase [Clostridia bacterium]
MRLFDTHTHLLDERFDPDRNAVLNAIRESNVALVVEACADRAGIKKIPAFCLENDFVYGSVGIHPHSADELTADALDELNAAAHLPKVVAIGEIGLDYHYDFSPRDVQRRAFSEQLDIAAQNKLPVIIHDREAHGDMMDILRAHKNNLCGVMHCFSGSYETARDCLNLGLYIAFGGALTFKNAARLADVAARLPLDRLLIETDCPYMTPVPLRGKRNDPTLMYLTLQKLAQVRNADVEELAEVTFENGRRVFGV